MRNDSLPEEGEQKHKYEWTVAGEYHLLWLLTPYSQLTTNLH